MKKILITGCFGLIGTEASIYFANRGYKVFGIDNNAREKYFGADGSINSNCDLVYQSSKNNFQHSVLNVADPININTLVGFVQPDAIINAAAQPSHDKAASMAMDDFKVNAMGTMILLEAARKYCPEKPFVFLSTNKVYGDNPNNPALVGSLLEEEKRLMFSGRFTKGIDENFSIDRCLHSVFGASKAAADIMVQEYGRYFGMPTVSLRCGAYHRK